MVFGWDAWVLFWCPGKCMDSVRFGWAWGWLATFSGFVWVLLGDHFEFAVFRCDLLFFGGLKADGSIPIPPLG